MKILISLFRFMEDMPNLYETLLSEPMEANLLAWLLIPGFAVLVYMFNIKFNNLELYRMGLSKRCRYKWKILALSQGLILLMMGASLFFALVFYQQPVVLGDIIFSLCQLALLLTVIALVTALTWTLFNHSLLATILTIAMGLMMPWLTSQPWFITFFAIDQAPSGTAIFVLLMKMVLFFMVGYLFDEKMMAHRQVIY